MTYPQWWERLVAAIIDGIILAVVYFLIELIFRGIATSLLTSSIFMAQLVMAISVVLYVAVIVAYKGFFEGGKWQATPGKMVFGLQVQSDGGGKPDMKSVIMRTWPWWIYLIVALAWLISLTLAGTLYFVILVVNILIVASFFMAPVGRCIHDQTANLHIVKSGKGMVGGS